MMNKVIEARSLALRFMSANPCCIRAIPYENGSEDIQPLTVRLYVDSDGKGIPKHVKDAAQEMFSNYQIEFDDLERRPLSKIVIQLLSSQKQRDEELSDLSRTIEKNLHVFENRLNVTAVQASYKVADSIEQDIPCVKVFVLGKGRVPAGETDIKEIKQLNGYPFDVAEGYYQPAYGSSLQSYASPLRGGVGIGVQGVHGAGTLGGFLEDEEEKYYILSNQHVFHPPEVGNNTNNLEMKNATNDIIILQPAQSDYDAILKNANAKLENHKSKKSNMIRVTQEQIDIKNDEYLRAVLERIEKQISEADNDLKTIERNKPRPIGKYVCGLEDNVEVTLGDSTFKFYVDAAIAELNKDELLDIELYKCIENDTNFCPLYGFQKNEDWNWDDDIWKRYRPNGETVDLEDFVEQLRTQGSDMTFMKIGRTTGLTDEGFIDTSSKEMFINCISAQFQYCSDCIQSVSASQVCTKCGKRLGNGDEIKSFWARNCFVFRKRRRPFCEKGDSGALVFGEDNQAWGLLFGVFMDLSKEFLFSLVSPLCVTLKALQRVSGKKKLKLWSLK